MHAFQVTRFQAIEPGPRLLVTGAVHGNEVCGTRAIRRLIDEFQNDQRQLLRGSLSLVPICNPLAYQKGQRSGDRNLNRRLRPTQDPREFEDHVANWLCPLMQQHDILLDLHSFQAQGRPFVMVGPEDNSAPLQPFTQAAQELAWAKVLGVQRGVDGWLDTYSGRRGRSAERAMQAARWAAASTSTSSTAWAAPSTCAQPAAWR
jgi:predicted deacylase